MDLDAYRTIKDVLGGFELSPMPGEDDDLGHFDVVSESAEISPAEVVNKLTDTANLLSHMGPFTVAAAQSHRVTIRDLGVE